MYSSFNSHKNRQHIASAVSDFCNDIVCVHSSTTHVIHVSNTAIQEIVDHLNEIFTLSQPLIEEAINNILHSNIVLSATSKGGELSSSKRRRTFIEHNYPLVIPVEYQLEPTGHTIMYVSILQMIQELFKNTDILTKIRELDRKPGHYASYCDGAHFHGNELLSTEDLNIAIQLYIDELQIANPLGTSRKVYKLCAVY